MAEISIDGAAHSARSRLVVDPDATWLRDHFPGNPIVPGLVMLEAAVRTAAALYAGDPARQTAATLARVHRLHVVRPVSPREVLQLRADLIARDDAGATFRADARVGDEVAMRAHFRLSPVLPWSHHDDEG